MSLDVDLMMTKKVSIYTANITHNLGKMAEAVKLANGHTLYEVLWRPDEHGWKTADDIAEMLDEGYNILLAEPETFMKHNPENGWGSYEGLCYFVYRYRNACWDDPTAEVSVSR